MSVIVPAILTNDEETYSKQLLQAESVCHLVQIDVIDGEFAKNETVGVETIKKYQTTADLEIQLMVNHPKNYIDELVKVEYVSKIIFPFEIEDGIAEEIYQIKNQIKQAGLSINPGTPVEAISQYLEDLDLLLILGVEPGFSGQAFIPSVLEKVKIAKKLAPGLAVEIDGGVNFDNVASIAQAGTDFIAANSVVFKAPDFSVAYEKLAKLASI